MKMDLQGRNVEELACGSSQTHMAAITMVYYLDDDSSELNDPTFQT